MNAESVTFRDIVPLATAVAGYIVGTLRTAAANLRERRKALNAVVYALLKLRRDVDASNPRQTLVQLSRLLIKRFGEEAIVALAQPGVRNLVYDAVRSFSADRMTNVAQRCAESIGMLVPFCPLLAYRLAGDRVAQLHPFVSRYYDSIRARPGVVSDPRGSEILAAMEDQTLDVAFKKTQEELADDIRCVAAKISIFSRLRILRTLRMQDDDVSDDEFEAEFGAHFDGMLHRVNVIIRPPQTDAT
jgi:hypothetical protein